MASEVFKLIGRVTLDGADKVKSNLKEIGGGAEGLRDNLLKTGESMKQVGGSMTKWITGPIVGLGAALTGITKKTANFGEEVLMTATKTGTSVEGLQKMRFALDQLGVEGADRLLGRLNQRMGRAADGNEKYQESLERLGISIEDVKNGTISTEEAMIQSIETLRGMESSQEQAAAAGELFGTRAARDLLPALRNSEAGMAELMERAEELGIVMSEDAAVQSEIFNDKLHELREQGMALVRSIGEKVMPIFIDSLIPMLQDKAIPMVESFVNRIVGLIEGFTNLPGPVQALIGGFVGLITIAGPVLAILGQMITMMSGLAPLISALGPVIAAVFTGPAAPFILAGIAIVAMIKLFQRFGDDIVKFIVDAVTIAIEWWSDFITSMVENISELPANVIGYFVEMYEGIRDTVLGLIESAKQWGRDIVSGITQGIRDTIMAPVDAVRGMADSVTNAIKSRLGISSPSKEFAIIGNEIVNGMNEGIEGADDPLTRLVNLIVQANEVWTGFKDLILNSITEIVPVFGSLGEIATNQLAKIMITTIELTEVFANFQSQIGSLIQSLNQLNSISDELGIEITGGSVAIEGINRLQSAGNINNGDDIRENNIINLDIDYDVTDQETAEYANDDLIRKLKEKGFGGAFR